MLVQGGSLGWTFVVLLRIKFDMIFSKISVKVSACQLGSGFLMK